MRRADRLFEIIQVLRSARRPLTGVQIAERLEVSARTIYRDIAALQAMRVPIEGAAGVGYVMRWGYDLPPLNFDAEETEAIMVGLRLLARTGDTGLQRAAARVTAKIDAGSKAAGLEVSDWGVSSRGGVEISALRDALREERKLRLWYCDEHGRETERVVSPIAIVYYIEVVVLAAWCALRDDFRHFRTDRIARCDVLEERVQADMAALRDEWSRRREVGAAQ